MTFTQWRHRISKDSNDNIYIVWESSERDGSSFGIYASKFDRQFRRLSHILPVADHCSILEHCDYSLPGTLKSLETVQGKQLFKVRKSDSFEHFLIKSKATTKEDYDSAESLISSKFYSFEISA